MTNQVSFGRDLKTNIPCKLGTLKDPNKIFGHIDRVIPTYSSSLRLLDGAFAPYVGGQWLESQSVVNQDLLFHEHTAKVETRFS